MSLYAELVKPAGLESEKEGQTGNFGRFIAEPLERGYGTTLGNSLRRVVISSLKGAAFCAVRIEGVFHEFSTIPGVMEDVTDVILNLKEVVIEMDSDQPVRVTFRNSGTAGELTAGDLVCPNGVKVLNPEHHIATMNKESNVDIELIARIGRGYVPAERNAEEMDLGPMYIPMDSVFSPVRRCSFRVEKTRVGEVTDYDKLVLEVETNGTIAPDDAVAHAAKILNDNLRIFINFEEEEVLVAAPEVDEGRQKLIENLSRSVEEMELSVRSYNCLKNARIHSLAELVQKTEGEMLKTRNFGRKSLNEIRDILNTMGLTFGMDFSHFKVTPEELGLNGDEN